MELCNAFVIKKILLRIIFGVLFSIYLNSIAFSQSDTNLIISFDFNEGVIKEKNNLVIPKPVGVSLTEDRFGNPNHAVYTQGHSTSYLNLGVSNLLKPNKVTVSLWVKLDRRVYEGKGYDCNPILSINNAPGHDFTNAIAIAYECYNKKFAINSTRDSTKAVTIATNDTIAFGKWYHIVFQSDSNNLKLYLNGKLEGSCQKGFLTKYDIEDSLLIGHSGDTKNERYSMGIFDDIQIFHRVLSEQEIQDLYKAPNPNKAKQLLQESIKYLIIIGALVIIIVGLIIRNKRNLKRQKDQLELVNRISELELKVVKAQMNPHFISNCLAAIQELIYSREVDKAGQYIAKFSFFLRQVLNYSDKNFIALSQEIEIIKLNIELEQLRFKNQFVFEIEGKLGLINSDIDVPALITQPFIENAIWHGLLPLKDTRSPKLIVRIFRDNDLLFIEIEDNGVGRDVNVRKENSKGTKLVVDKIESLNHLSGTRKYELQIVDLKNKDGNPVGTKVILQFNVLKDE